MHNNLKLSWNRFFVLFSILLLSTFSLRLFNYSFHFRLWCFIILSKFWMPKWQLRSLCAKNENLQRPVVKAPLSRKTEMKKFMKKIVSPPQIWKVWQGKFKLPVFRHSSKLLSLPCFGITLLDFKIRRKTTSKS